ncbi:MAG: ASKHA domain-containing protein [Anaerolineae bacterium]|jgi:uncharacterized 2Fe-2S/4Fe-4S cluster protein (DUF4445 family)
MTIYVDFEPVGRRGDCPEGESLLECARQLGVDLANLCGGVGSCARCVIQILEGDVSEPTDSESDHFSFEELAEGYRLACRTMPRSDCKVRVPPESLTTPQRTQVEGDELQVDPEPPVQTYPVAVPGPSLDDLRADATRLVDALAGQHGVGATSFDIAALRQLPRRLRECTWQVQAAVRNGEIVAVLPEPAQVVGLAVDLGTTKIAAYLVELTSGQTLASRGIMNPQIAYGEDVVARMAYAQRAPAQASRMQALVVDALNQALSEMCAETGVETEQVIEAVVVGNTAMHHLFLHLPVEQLARAPYVPAVGAALDIKARELGLQIAPGAYVHLLPNIAGYVGADHVAMLLATQVAQTQDQVILAIDIGTNTEVCLTNHGTMVSTSCASGPAFEGAHIRHGMRAANGAIERLRLSDGHIEYQTIGGAPPVGLCGSGILDVLAQLVVAGVVDANGRMGEHPRVRAIDGDPSRHGTREFVLVSEEEQRGEHPAITFTQKDVRELQLAKGAMRTGIETLLATSGLEAEDIEQVIIAGAFGTYIDVESAITIGMLPSLPLDRFRQVGNAAGIGAKLALISKSKRREAQEMRQRIDYVELATDPGFIKNFSQAMYLR